MIEKKRIRILHLNYKYVGGYLIGEGDCSYMFMFKKKPKAVHRFFMRLLLCFKWVDEVEE